MSRNLYPYRDGYPYYIHTNEELSNYWMDYFTNPLYSMPDDDSLGMYFDFPFCRSQCKYCAFKGQQYSNFETLIPEYENAVINTLQTVAPAIPRRINNVYFGGGTPTLWNENSLLKIKSLIPGYDNIKLKTVEVHPFDLTDEKIDFLINDLKVTTVSIGIQSFDRQANLNQNRIPVDIDRLEKVVQRFKDNHIYVNMDIVAWFDDYRDPWKIFQEDLEILATRFRPDDICMCVNFNTDHFYDKSLELRKYLIEFLNKYPEWILEHENATSLNMNDVLEYREEVYHIRLTNYFCYYINANPYALEDYPIIAKKHSIVSFGGIYSHNSYSRAGRKNTIEQINSYYDFFLHKFIHTVLPVKYDYDHIPQYNIGKCFIKP